MEKQFSLPKDPVKMFKESAGFYGHYDAIPEAILKTAKREWIDAYVDGLKFAQKAFLDYADKNDALRKITDHIHTLG